MHSKHCTPNVRFSAPQTNHGWICTDQLQVSHLQAPKVKRGTATLIPGCAGGTGITFISGDWSRRNGGKPFPQIITRQAEKPVCDNTEIPDTIDQHIPVKARWDRMSPHKPPNKGQGDNATKGRPKQRKTAIDGETPYQYMKTHKLNMANDGQ